MKMRSYLFAVLSLLPLAACGGDREKPTVTPQPRRSVLGREPAARSSRRAGRCAGCRDAAPEAVTPVVVDVMPSTFDDALTQGKALASKGEHDRAKELFEAAIEARPEEGRAAHRAVAPVHLDERRALAVIAANKAVKLAPLSSQAWNTKGRAELNRFDYDKAIEAFSKACELDQDNVWAWNNLGYTELQLKKYDEAVEHLTEATTSKGADGLHVQQPRHGARAAR